MTIKFDYSNDVPTVESALGQAIGAASVCWDNLAGTFRSDRALEVHEAALAEIRRILASELTTLLDREGVARDWNDAVELCIQTVEGTV